LKWWSGDVSHEAHADYRPAARRAATAALAGDTAAGEKIFKAQCGICHAVAAGENRIGPTLFGVVGRPAGSVPGFNYTADHKKSASPGTPHPRQIPHQSSRDGAGYIDGLRRSEGRRRGAPTWSRIFGSGSSG
jgi:mono/diheme cytochrome c family protein